MLKRLALAGALLMTPAVCAASSLVDLNLYSVDPPLSSNGNWVATTDGRSVSQSLDGLATVFTDPSGASHLGTRITFTAKARSEAITDDDYFGFVLGYRPGDLLAASSDFIVVDWKRLTQVAPEGVAPAGLWMSRVTGPIGTDVNTPFYRTGPVSILQRGSGIYESTGWTTDRDYDFDVTYTAGQIDVSIDGVEAFSETGTFADGSFGFYTLSQGNIEFSELRIEALPDAPAVPLPASLPFLMAGLTALFALHRRS